MRLFIVSCGDMAIFILFPLLGLLSHEEAFSTALILRNAFPFAAGWYVLSPATGIFFSATLTSATRAALTVGLAWPICALLGLALRTWLFDRPWAWSFALVSMLVQGLMLLIWRVVFARFVRAP